MRVAIALILASVLTFGSAEVGQDRPRPVSLIQLIATPEKFDGKKVSIIGFLTLGEHPEFFGQQPMLFLHEEDAKNILRANALWVVPNDQMRQDREKINQEYVIVTGRFRAASGVDPGAYQGGTITDVQSCEFWSDPRHPLGVKVEIRKNK